MNVVETAAPISIEQLKLYFTNKDTFYNIKYKDSSLKDIKLLTYLSNLDIPCDIDVEGCDSAEIAKLISSYLHCSTILNNRYLEISAISILLQYKGIIAKMDNSFIEENKTILDKWVSKLDSLTLYNMGIVSENTFKEFVESFPNDETTETVGVNFVSLLKHPEFYSFYEKVDKTKLVNYSKYFSEHMFKGKCMYDFWANVNNPLFLLTYSIANGDIKGEDFPIAAKTSLEEIANATSI